MSANTAPVIPADRPQRRLLRALATAGFWATAVARDVGGLAARRTRRGAPILDVNIEPSNLCNANCVFCGYQFQERPHQEINDDVALSVIGAAKAASVTRLGLTPIVGEPLVHRRLEQIIRAAASPPNAMHVGLTTNAILLTAARYRSLVDAGLRSIDISMSFPDEEEYRRIYRSPKLKTVMTNLSAILDSYQAGECSVTIAVRTHRYRGWSDHPLLHRARAAGWHLVRNLFFDDWSGRTASTMAPEDLFVRPNRPKRLPCLMTYAGPHFLSDGRATACGCRDLDGRSELALSPTALLQDMKAVYSNGAVSQLREQFRRGDAPEICQTCRHYNPVYEGESLALRVSQLAADIAAACGVSFSRRRSLTK